jgi:hypothetical protein
MFARPSRCPLAVASAGLVLAACALVGCDDGAPAGVAHASVGVAPPAPRIPAAVAVDAPVLDAERDVPAAEASEAADAFLGEADAPRLRALATAAVASVEKGRGGRSLAFEITLADGTRGYFKPEQSFSAAHFWSELAAYHLDRELGFGRVPATVGRRFSWEKLRQAAGADRRVRELAIAPDGTVRGAFIAWVTGGLDPLPLPREWERWVRVQPGVGLTPYQRPAEYRAMLHGSRDPSLEALDPRRPLAEASADTAERPAELSDLLVFDYLVQNVDRWGGGFTNVRTRGPGGPLVFLDNGAGFWPNEQRLPLMEARLRHLQRFRRSTVEALRRFDRARFEARLARDPLAPLLEARQLDGLEARIAAALAHVDAMHEAHGEAIYFDDGASGAR